MDYTFYRIVNRKGEIDMSYVCVLTDEVKPLTSNQLNKDKISKSKKLYYLKNKEHIKYYNNDRYHKLKDIRLKEQQEAYNAAEIFN